MMKRVGGVSRRMVRSLTSSHVLRGSGGLLAAVLLIVCTGCTSWRDYLHNGFKVGPNYCRPNAAVAEHWIDATDIRTEENPEVLRRWWTVFNDRKLNELITCAYRQNLTLREAGFRILQARATRNIAVGNIFPQQQGADGSYSRNAMAMNSPTSSGGIGRFSDSWNLGFNLNWELDFWGRFRRAIASADASLDASVADYDDVLVTLLGDVATNYVTLRTTQERIKLLQENAKLQRGILQYIQVRMEAGFKQTELDLNQALSTLRQTESGIPKLEITSREAEDNLCILLGMPPVDLTNMLGIEPIPISPPDVVIGIPADLLRRRPDVRRAERLAAAQAEQIGIAQSDLYPAFSINGNFGYTANNFPDLFKNTAFNGSVGPSFQWNLLNYGRIVNNVRYQDARFQELVVAYQNTVLQANKEVEKGLVEFLRSQRQSRLLDESVVASQKAVAIVIAQYENGAVDFNRYALIEQNLVTQQDSAAQARGQISQGLISAYRALGGGWEIRLGGEAAAEGVAPVALPTVEGRVSPNTAVPKPPAPEEVPMPQPAPNPPKNDAIRSH
jgi:NodT family efflux transporter outer membrane factor (OMF) lipoprotein